MVACYSQRIVAGTPQTEMARIIPDTRPSALLAAVQNRSRRFCVRRVEELFAFADRIEQAARAALSRVNNLTQSILAKAFANNIRVVGPSGQPTAVQNRSRRFCSGELTADWRAANPELISGDNSAEALLARIKAERAKLKLTKKAKA